MARWFVDRSPQRGIPSVSLRRLLPEARFVGCHDLHVSGCSDDSRRIDPGQVFVAVRGARHDGHRFVARALERGAAAVVVERPLPEAGRPQVVVPDSRAALARLCHALAGEPAARLPVIGITGATGRSAAALYLRAIYEAAGLRLGTVGAAGWDDGANAHPPGAAEPGPAALAEMLAIMADRGCAGAAIEAGPDALGRHDLAGLELDAAIVTGIRTCMDERAEFMHDRRRSCARLFRLVTPGGAAIVNADDADADLLSAVNLAARRVSFGVDAPADVSARIDSLGRDGTRLRLRGFDREAVVALRPIGRAQVGYALAAAALAWTKGVSTDAVVDGLESVGRLPGRLEPIGGDAAFTAHHDRPADAAELAEALDALRSLNPGQVHCVLAVGGPDGPALARLAEPLADRLVLTVEDPRFGNADARLDAARDALARPGRARVDPDRRRALSSALALARPGDALLVAGSGLHALHLREHREAVQGWLRSAAGARRSA